MVTTTVDWDAASYDRLADPQEEWGRAVLERLVLAGDETVLDAGCGSGRVTRLILQRLPRGRVIGVDASPSMVALARQALAGESAEVRCQNLLDLSLPERVDAAFSNATFHWIADHERLFRRLHDALHPGGRLAAQCGGQGNVEVWVRAVLEVASTDRFAEHLATWNGPWNFAGVDETEHHLSMAGFGDVRCWLEERVVEPGDPRNYVATVGLAAHLDRLPQQLRDDFVDATVEALPRPLVLRYVRLNIDATKPT
jgi:trans-aconitate 2-methyltransferase